MRDNLTLLPPPKVATQKPSIGVTPDSRTGLLVLHMNTDSAGLSLPITKHVQAIYNAVDILLDSGLPSDGQQFSKQHHFHEWGLGWQFTVTSHPEFGDDIHFTLVGGLVYEDTLLDEIVWFECTVTREYAKTLRQNLMDFGMSGRYA